MLSLTVWLGSVWYLLELESGRRFTAQIACGAVVFMNQDSTLAADSNRVLPGVKFGPLVPGCDWWFGFYHDATGLWTVKVPLWTFAALFAGVSWRQWRSHLRRPREGTCPKCNYSLTGLPTGAACPECGKAASVKA